MKKHRAEYKSIPAITYLWNCTRHNTAGYTDRGCHKCIHEEWALPLVANYREYVRKCNTASAMESLSGFMNYLEEEYK